MEYDEMKILWDGMNQKIEEQKILTDKLILDMTKERYENKLRAISIPETIGALICFALATYIMIHFNKLNIWYLQVLGGFTIALCIIMPILSLKSIRKMTSIDISSNTYKESLIAFYRNETKFKRIQKISFYVSFLVLISAVITLGKIEKDIDVFIMTEKLKWMIPSGIGLLFIFTQWVLKKYKKVTTSAKDILKDLEN